MSLLPAVILAQVVSAGIGDRVEVRQVVDIGTRQLEAENSAYVTGGLSYPWLTATLTYSPSLVLAPLEESPRDLTLTNTVFGNAESLTTLYQASRFAMTLQVVATYLQRDYGRSLINSPLPAAARPPSDPQTPPDASSAEVVSASGITTRLATIDTDLGFTESLSRRSTLSESVGYAASVGVDGPSRVLYPFTHGPTASLAYIYIFNPRDTLTSELEGSMAMAPSTGNRAYRLDYEERLVHLFSRQTYSEFSIGVAYTRAELDEGTAIGVTPTAEAAITTNMKAAGGDLSLGMRLTYGPELDRTALVFDTRIGVEGNIGWTKGRFTSYAGTSTAVSVNPEDAGSLTGVSGNAGVRYDLGAGFMTEGGIRFAYQEYEGSESIPATWVAFVALAWGFELL